MNRSFRSWLAESYSHILDKLWAPYRVHLQNFIVYTFQLRRGEDHVTMRDHDR